MMICDAMFAAARACAGAPGSTTAVGWNCRPGETVDGVEATELEVLPDRERLRERHRHPLHRLARRVVERKRQRRRSGKRAPVSQTSVSAAVTSVRPWYSLTAPATLTTSPTETSMMPSPLPGASSASAGRRRCRPTSPGRCHRHPAGRSRRGRSSGSRRRRCPRYGRPSLPPARWRPIPARIRSERWMLCSRRRRRRIRLRHRAVHRTGRVEGFLVDGRAGRVRDAGEVEVVAQPVRRRVGVDAVRDARRATGLERQPSYPTPSVTPP